MKIAICDDDPAQQEYLESLLRVWGKERRLPLEIACFPGSEAFLFRWAEEKDWDLLILDIVMGPMNGMELARRLRKEKFTSPLLFITGFDEFMAQGFEVEALHYLLKPLREDQFTAVLDRALRQAPQEEKLLLAAREGQIALLPSEIWYLEAQGHHCVIATEDREWNLTESFGETEKKLTGPAFVLCRRGLVVNLRYVAFVGKTELEMDYGMRLPVSRGLREKVNQAFLNYFRKREGSP
ncbi:MAG: response regulator transcription factor [Clostridia bacterium]|nr:response regulator transcription factor [Clostridia bacterium]